MNRERFEGFLRTDQVIKSVGTYGSPRRRAHQSLPRSDLALVSALVPEQGDVESLSCKSHPCAPDTLDGERQRSVVKGGCPRTPTLFVEVCARRHTSHG